MGLKNSFCFSFKIFGRLVAKISSHGKECLVVVVVVGGGGGVAVALHTVTVQKAQSVFTPVDSFLTGN